ncbi:MAG: hypothetical protein ACYDDI_02100 [Candidatus Acidiferrales bacterium]
MCDRTGASDKSKNLPLGKAFRKQDDILEEHLNSSPLINKSFQMISEAIYSTVRILQSVPFEGDKREVVVDFSFDAISSVIVSARVGLWGNVPESLTILRAALERAVQLRYVVSESKYTVARYEMDHELKETSYDTAISALGNRGNNIRKLHGLISEAAAHATAKRLHFGQYEHKGEQFARLGLAHNPNGSLSCLYYCMYILMSLLEQMREAYRQDKITPPREAEIQDVIDRYQQLKAEMDCWFKTPDGNA